MNRCRRARPDCPPYQGRIGHIDVGPGRPHAARNSHVRQEVLFTVLSEHCHRAVCPTAGRTIDTQRGEENCFRSGACPCYSHR